MGPRFAKRLPRQALRQLAFIFGKWEQELALPSQVLTNIIVLLDKESGGVLGIDSIYIENVTPRRNSSTGPAL